MKPWLRRLKLFYAKCRGSPAFSYLLPEAPKRGALALGRFPSRDKRLARFDL